MKMAKDVALMAIGAGAFAAYQKYKKPVEKEIDKAFKKTVKMANQKLENMS